MHRFFLDRRSDPTGVSGTGMVAQGVQFDNGYAVMQWVIDERHPTLSIFPHGIEEILELHGHDGDTRVVVIDG